MQTGERPGGPSAPVLRVPSSGRPSHGPSIVTPGPRSWTLAAVAGALLAATFFALPPGPFTAPPPAWGASGTHVRGVFHVHTRRSDGTGTVGEVAEAASRAGLQFVILTDHGDAVRRPDPPAYRSGVLCIDAVEISTTGGHYAALGLGPAPYPLAGEPRDVAEDVRRLGGFGIVTHPLSGKAELAWRAWDVPVDAIEWLNGDSLWRGAPASRLVLAAWTYLFRPVDSLARLYRRPAELARWDTMALTRRVIALAGSDAHARFGFRDGPEPYANPVYLKVPSYRVAFEVASLRVRLEQPLTGRAEADADAVVGAIRAGRLHTIVDALGRNGAFEFTATSEGATAAEGGEVPLGNPAVIRVRSNPPPGGWLVLIRDGNEVHRVRTSELIYATDRPGAYRAEVWVPTAGSEQLRPWIVGNPIRVGPAATPQPPGAPDTGGPSVPLEEASNTWGVEHDPRSTAILDRQGGVGLSYKLAGSDTPSSFAAIGATTGIPPVATGLVFTARADRPTRVSVQIRIPTAGEGLRWHRSVYLDASPREIAVPFAEMTALGAARHETLRLSAVRTILFVVDRVNSLPNSSGRFTIGNVRFSSPSASRK